jgi:hypothetical protein
LQRNRFGAYAHFLKIVGERIGPFIEVFIPQSAVFRVLKVA